MSAPDLLTRLLILASILMPTMAHANDVTITREQVERMEIKVEAVRPAITEPVAVLPGTVVPPMNSRLVATAPFGGTVIQVHVLPGQRVTKGTPLATISSREFLEALSQLAQAEAELQLAEAIAQRKRSLVDKGFQSPTLAAEADAQVAKVRAVIAQLKRTASLNEIIRGDGGNYIIPAPADGTVVEARAMPGDMVPAMSAAVSIDTTDTLWVEAQVPAAIVAQIKLGDRVQVLDGPEGRVVSLGGSLDRLTRSAMLLASLPADSGLLPGQMVSLSIERPAVSGAITVPLRAVALVDNQHAVFVRKDHGFTLIPVALRGKSSIGATVTGAIQTDAQVAASGLPQLEQMLAGN
jgi:cobalt-zinc-cadmium efflux system membrane fusion protein